MSQILAVQECGKSSEFRFNELHVSSCHWWDYLQLFELETSTELKTVDHNMLTLGVPAMFQGK